MVNGFSDKNKTIKQLGLSLLEALVATAIVGIGFIAIFQMTKYSVESIAISSDRTRANYLVAMVAEDLIGNRHSKSGGNRFVDHLRNPSNAWKVDGCEKAPRKKADSTTLYQDEEQDAPLNKIRKWELLFSSDKHLKCRKSTASSGTTTTTGATYPTKDTKRLQIVTICDSGCDYDSPGIYDKMYIGRMHINMNEGKKRKFLYFQAHYVLE